MDGRFFSVPRSSYRPTYYYSVPVQRQTPVKSPTVVTIPVQFLESEPTRTRSRSESAEKIQAAFRGFMVRKYVRKIDRVRREVEEIERRVGEEEIVELMRIDKRERLKVNEALMSLLFRLDSVRGVDAGVREFRKKVIKKVIALQEKVDTIAAAAAAAADFADRKEGGADEVEQSEVGVDSPDQEGDRAEDEQIEEQVADLSDREEGGCTAARREEPVLDLPGQKKEGGVEADQSEVQIADVADQKEGCGQTEESEDRDFDSPDQEESGAEAKQIEDQVSNGSSGGLDHVIDNVNDACDLLMEMEPAVFETSIYGESGTDPSLKLESFLEEVDENGPIKEDNEPESFLEEVDENAPIKEDNEPEDAELFEKEVEESAEENGHVGKDKNAGDGKHNNRSEEMLGRMMEDNEKMMGMMVQLFERNEQHMQLLSLLSQRVERLEKALLCEKLRRKKKREATEGQRLLNSNECRKKF